MEKTPNFATDNKDGRKSPEVIKKNARTCISQPATESCYCCPLHGECHGLVEYVIKDLLDLVLMYESRLAQVKREMDALEERIHGECSVCVNGKTAMCNDCIHNEWAWHPKHDYWKLDGGCEGNAKEDFQE